MNGAAVTGGFELALACDFMIASERARFADTHLRVGVYPGPVAVDLPRRVGMAYAREMSLTGDFIDAAEALRIGLVNHVVPHEQLLDVAMAKARSIAEQPPAMVAMLRQDWTATDRLPLEEARRVHYEHAARGGFGSATGPASPARREAVIARARPRSPPMSEWSNDERRSDRRVLLGSDLPVGVAHVAVGRRGGRPAGAERRLALHLPASWSTRRKDYERDFPEGYIGVHTSGQKLLRVAASVRDSDGPRRRSVTSTRPFGGDIHVRGRRAEIVDNWEAGFPDYLRSLGAGRQARRRGQRRAVGRRAAGRHRRGAVTDGQGPRHADHQLHP